MRNIASIIPDSTDSCADLLCQDIPAPLIQYLTTKSLLILMHQDSIGGLGLFVC